VTGANRGIGLAICENLLKNYPDVHVLLGSRDLAKGEAAAKDLATKLNCADRIEAVALDTSSDESVNKAVEQVSKSHPTLYGIVNNAGILESNPMTALNTNYFGIRRVNDSFGKLLKRPGGRIVNIGSASGPMYVSSLRDKNLVTAFSQPWTIKGGIAELDDMAKNWEGRGDGYGTSKAFVAAYTKLHAMEEPDLIINAVTPGFIASDMGKSLGATKAVYEGSIPPVYCLMDKELETFPTGRYYGSDCKRSPLDTYRGPGDPVYEGPDGP
jgi:carbonyl reductase 1